MSTNGESVDKKLSYSLNAWQRLATVSKALVQTESNVSKLKKEIARKLELTDRIRQRKSELQSSQIIAQGLEDKLRARIGVIKAQSFRVQRSHINVEKAAVSFADLCLWCREKQEKSVDLQAVVTKLRSKLAVTVTQLLFRRREMLQDLQCVYRVVEDSSCECPCQQRPILRISAVHLPDAENFPGHDETSLAVALGYVAHLLSLLSRIWDLPLRYETENIGGRSAINDHILPNMSDVERHFPLFLKGQDRQRFQYGVFLLNKDIAQFRFHCGLPTKDLRLTLGNVKGLVEFHFSATVDQMFFASRPVNSNPSAAPSSPSHQSSGSTGSSSKAKEKKLPSDAPQLLSLDTSVESEILFLSDQPLKLKTNSEAEISNGMDFSLHNSHTANICVANGAVVCHSEEGESQPPNGSKQPSDQLSCVPELIDIN